MHAPVDNGTTPFIAACSSSIQIVRELKDAGADPGATDNDGFNAVHIAPSTATSMCCAHWKAGVST